MINRTLDRYAGSWPVSRGYEEKLAKVEKRRKAEGNKASEILTVAERLRNSTRELAFGVEIKKRLLSGNVADSSPPSTLSQIAYSGM